jgi:hypothetical protein
MAIGLGISGCGDDGPRGLIARLILEDGRTSFSVGEPIHMRLEITNHTGDIVRITYPDEPRYSFAVYHPSGDSPSLVWWWSSPLNRNDPNPQEWKERATVSFETTWDQVNDEGERVPSGSYVATASNAACHTGVNFHCDSRANASFEISP